MATPHYRMKTISRGSKRTLKNGTVRVTKARHGGSMVRRAEYIERGGSLANRADEVLHLGVAGPRVGLGRGGCRRSALRRTGRARD